MVAINDLSGSCHVVTCEIIMTFSNVCWTLFLVLSTSLIFFELAIHNSNRRASEVLSRPKIHPESRPQIYLNTSQGTRVQKLKRILYWTPYFMAEDWQFGFGSKPFRNCPQPNCAGNNAMFNFRIKVIIYSIATAML